MKPTGITLACVALLLWCVEARADYRDLTLPRKISHCVLVAEIRIDSAELGRRDPVDYEVICHCTILQGFKLPIATNALTFRVKYDQPHLYKGKIFLLFAVEGEVGYRPNGSQKPVIGYRPYGEDCRGLVEKGAPHSYMYVEDGAVGTGPGPKARELQYGEVIERIKAITKAKQGEPAK